MFNKELLEKLKNAKSNEEVKQIIEDNKSLLTDEELDKVSGGASQACWLDYYD